MKNTRVIAVAFTLFALLPPASAQKVSLVSTSSYVLPNEWGNAVYVPPRCDADGNFYLRQYESGLNATPVLKVTARAESVTRFDLSSVQELKGGSVEDFTVTPDGEVYQLIRFDNDVIIAEFSRDGHLSSQTKLEKQFWPSHIAIIGNSGFLVTGTEWPTKTGPPPKLVTAIFDRSGKFVRNLVFRQDPAAIEPAKWTPKIAANPFASELTLPLVLGDTQADNSGRLFVLRASTPAVVYIAESSGRVLRTIKVKPPDPSMRVKVMQVQNGRLALLAVKADENGQTEMRVMITIDTTTGQTMAEYNVPAGLGGAFACYTGDSFGFVISEGRKLGIETAKPD